MATNPFDYLNRFKPGAAPVPKPADPMAATLDAMREDDLRAIMRDAGDPAQTADVTKLSRETGLPPALIEDRVADVKRDLAAGKLTDVLKGDPALAKWAASNPRGAAAARDDAKSLGMLGSAWDTIKKLPATGKAAVLGLGTQGAKVNYALTDFFGELGDAISSFTAPNTQTVGGLEKRQADRKAYWNAGVSAAALAQEQARPSYTGFVQRNVLQGLESVPSSLMALGAGAISRNPNVALGMMGAQTGLPAYADARIAGKAIPTALKYGIEQGGIEALTEKIPANALLDAVAKKTPFGKALMAQIASEVPGEQVATVLQDLSTWATMNPGKTVGQFIAERPEAALSTLLQTVSGTTAQTGLAVATSRAVDAVGAHLDRRGAARRAEGERQFFDKAGKVAQESKLRELDPEAFQDAVRAKAEAEGVTHVMVPGEAVATYMQSDSYDQEEGVFAPFADQIAEAAAIGGDVVLPVEFALGVLPATPAWDALKDDLRLTPGGLSPREADADAGQIDADIEAMAADLAKRDKALGDRVAVVEELTQRIADKLMNAGYTPYAARQQAVLIATRQGARAARTGKELDLGAWDATEVRAVAPEALAAARKADATDLVINAMRKGGAAEVQSGKSLLPWIAARGGIEDRGGDIAAMGGDKWHRGKVGQKKLLKPFEEAQGNMLGGATNDNSVERLFDAAISEGFFPDLYAAREAGEKIDNRAFLDAIGAELRGSPIYAGEAQVDGIRAAAEELTALLAQRGVDASTLSDAELRAAIDGLRDSEDGAGFDQGAGPVATVTGTEIAPKGASIKDLRARAKDWFVTHLRGTSIRSDAMGRDVEFASPKKMLAFTGDAQKMRAIPALRGIISKGELLSTTAPYDRGREPSVRAYHRIGATISMGGERKRVEVTIRETADGNLYYDHLLPENAARNPEAPDYKTGPGETGGALEQVAQGRDKFNLTVQALNDGPRGRIMFPGDGRSIIELFQARNLSTLIHEVSHQWLEELRADAEGPDATDQLKADWQTVQDWFAANNVPLVDGVIPVEAHEMFARGGERYMMEGKAPSTALQGVFETFRGWLVAIYKVVDALRSPITPEIRGVFDRLIATDEEIARTAAEQALSPLFKDAAAIGMTGAEFDAYTAQVANARGEAHGALLDKTMAAIRRRETAKWREDRKGVMADIAEEVAQRPLYRALAALKDTPLSKEWLVSEFGVDAADLLPRRVPPIYRDGGAHPSDIAELAGYTNGREMIEALIGAELAHRQAKEGGDQRTMRARTVETETDTEMNRRYGDTLNDGSIEREALEAVHNEMQGEVMATEIRALARRTGQRATPYQLARRWARGKVRQGVYATEASPSAIQRHARNAAKAGREAEKAMMAGNAEDAFRFKQQQMLSSALLTEAKAAHDEVEAARKRLDKIARRATMKSVDQDYLDQAHTLLENVDLRERSQKSIDRRGSWEAWAEARAAEGYEVVVPPSFEAQLGTTNWSRLTVENLVALDQAVAQVIHLGRLKQTLLDGKDRREFEALLAEAREGAGNIKGPPPKGMDEGGMWDAIKGKFAQVDAALLKMETVFDWLDGGNPNGVFNRIVFRPIADAQAREQDMLKDYYGRIKAQFEAVPGETIERWRDRVSTPFIERETGRPWAPQRQRLIAAALNIGNEGNLQRLADGYGYNPQALEAFLVDELTADEWQFVQGVWDTIETLWPEIEALEKRVNGVAPDKVEPREVVTPYGTMRGGYYPAVYDSTRDLKAEADQGKEADLFQSVYTRATTRASATKARADAVSRPILLDLGVINRHLGEVIHDITHREPVIQANRFLSSERVMRLVDEALGPEIRKAFRPWVKFVANSWALERAGNEGVGKFLGKLRANATAVGMGLRATTMVTQLSGYANSIEVIGEKAMAEGIARMSAHPVEAFNFVLENSDEVRHRMDTLDRDLRTQLAVLASANPASKAARKAIEAKRFFFHGIGYMDRVVVVPTWLGAYHKALAAGMEEADARYAGDKAVRQSQGAGAPKDMAAVVRGTGRYGEALKLFTMFYSYLSALYQRERTLARDMGGADTRRPRNMPRLAARAFWLIIVPPLLTELLKASLGGGQPPEDDEWWAQWVSRKMLANALGTIPLARDVFEPAWNKARGARAFDPDFSPVNRIGASVVNAIGDLGKAARGEETKKATKNVLEAVGYATGLVPGQVASAAQFLVDVGQGDAEPETFGQWVEGLSTGKIEDD